MINTTTAKTLARTCVLAFILMFFSLGYSAAQTKVVVVPLGGDESTLDIFYGSVTSAGELEHGNIASATRISTGTYFVTINRSTTGCNAVTSPGSYLGGATDTVGINTVRVTDDGFRVTNRRDRSPIVNFNTDFHITIICAKM